MKYFSNHVFCFCILTTVFLCGCSTFTTNDKNAIKQLESVSRSATMKAYQYNAKELNDSELETYLETDLATLENNKPYSVSSDIIDLWNSEKTILNNCIFALRNNKKRESIDPTSAIQTLIEEYPIILNKSNEINK